MSTLFVVCFVVPAIVSFVSATVAYRFGHSRGVERGKDEQYISDFIIQRQPSRRCSKCGRFTPIS